MKLKAKTNRKNPKGNEHPKISLFKLLIKSFMTMGLSAEASQSRAHHQAFLDGGNPEFHPRKHTVMNYATQNRIAKKNRAHIKKKK